MKISGLSDDKVNTSHSNPVQIHTPSSHINPVQIHTLSLLNLFGIRVSGRQNTMALSSGSKFLSAFAPSFPTSLLHHEVSSSTGILSPSHRPAATFFGPSSTRHEIRSLSRHLAAISLSSGRRPPSRRSAAIKSGLSSEKRKCHDIQFLSRRLAAISLSDNRLSSQRSASVSGLSSSTQKRKSVSQINSIMLQYMAEVAAAHYINEPYDWEKAQADTKAMFRALKRAQNEEYKKRMAEMAEIAKEKVRQPPSAPRGTFFKDPSRPPILDQPGMRVKAYSGLKRL